MKTRLGFVSNSSSSSYIIALKQTLEKCPHCGRKDRDFLETLEITSAYNEDNQVVATDKEEVIHGICANTTEEEKAIVEKIEKYVKDGYKIASITISYHDQPIHEEMEVLQDKGDLVIIDNEY